MSAVSSGTVISGRKSWLENRIVNVAAAVMLVVAIGAGYWFSGIGPGGGGSGDDPRRYAAQVVTPAASPDAAAVGCEVEPLTVDEVMAIVRNPLNPLNDMGVGLAASPVPLLEAPAPEWFGLPVGGPGGIEEEIRTPGEAEFSGIEDAAATYYQCLQTGTNFQIWALYAPDLVQTRILSNFPVFRDEEEIRDWVQRVGTQPAEGIQTPGVAAELEEMRRGDYVFQPNPARAEAIIVDAPRTQDPRLAWIGTEVVSEEGGILVSQPGSGPTFTVQVGDVAEVLVLIQWPGSDTWYVASITTVSGP